MKNILVAGVYYGHHNIGDEAILEGIVQNFSSHTNITAYSEGSSYLLKRFPLLKIKNIPYTFTKPRWGFPYKPRKRPWIVYSELQRIKSDLESTDLAIVGGATILSDCPWYSLGLAKHIKNQGIPTILFGVGMADLTDRVTLNFICDVCNMLDAVYVRDSFVKKRLIDIGVKDEQIKLCHDPAITLQPAINKEVPAVRLPKKINIGVSLSAENDIVAKMSTDQIAGILDSLVLEQDAALVFIPTNTRPGMDIDWMREIYNKCKQRDSMMLIEKEYEPQELISLCKELALIISSRLHLNILGSTIGVPSVGLVRNSKLIDYARNIGTEDLLVEFENIEEVLVKTRQAIKHNDTYRQTISENIKQMRELHQSAAQEIVNNYLS